MPFEYIEDEQPKSKFEYIDNEPTGDIKTGYNHNPVIDFIQGINSFVTTPVRRSLWNTTAKAVQNISPLFGLQPLPDDELASFDNYSFNTTKPSGISGFIGESAPWLLAPEWKGVSTLGTGVKTGAYLGGLVGLKGGIDSGDNISNLPSDFLHGVVNGGLTGGTLGLTLPTSLNVLSGLSKSIPEAGLWLGGVNPKVFEEAINNPRGKKIFTMSDRFSDRGFIKSMVDDMMGKVNPSTGEWEIGSIQKYRNKVNSQEANPLMEIAGSSENQLSLNNQNEILEALNTALEASKYNNKLSYKGERTPLGTQAEGGINDLLNNINFYLGSKKGTLNDLSELRNTLSQKAEWSKDAKDYEKGVKGVARDLYSALNEQMDKYYPAYRERDKYLAEMYKYLNNADTANLIDKLSKGQRSIPDYDLLVDKLSNMAKNDKSAIDALSQLGEQTKEYGIPLVKGGDIADRAKLYRLSNEAENVGSILGVPQAIRRAVGEPIILNTILPFLRQPWVKSIGKFTQGIGEKLHNFATSSYPAKLFTPHTAKPRLEGKIEYNDYQY